VSSEYYIQVRKSAIQLLRALVQKNPYAHTLPLSIFKDKLSGAEQQLEAAEQAVAAASAKHVKSGPAEGDDVCVDDEGGEGRGETQGASEVKKEVEGEDVAKECVEEAREEVAENKEIEELRSRVNFYQVGQRNSTNTDAAAGTTAQILTQPARAGGSAVRDDDPQSCEHHRVAAALHHHL
jgi:hypothetical protein